MKKPIKLIIALLIVAGLSYLAYTLILKRGNSVETELIDFAIKDVSKVDKIIISGDTDQEFTLIKDGTTWKSNKIDCIRQQNVDFILEAFTKIEFKGYLPENASEHQIKMMSAKHIKVQIFENGEWSKTWYIGPPAQDHYGQIMMLDSEEFGMSDKPVIMQIKGVKGIIEPRFYSDFRKWACTAIFELDPATIKKVDVKYVQEPSRSFSVVNTNNNYEVFQQNQKIEASTTMILKYIQSYKKIHFNMPNYSLNIKQVDSLNRTNPFCYLTVTETNGKSTRLKLHRVRSGEQTANEFGQLVDYDMDYLWCFLPSGELVKCQYYVFNPLILGHIYFPLDLKNVNTGDYDVQDPSKYRK